MQHSASTISRRRGHDGGRTVDALTTRTTERPYDHRTYDGNALFTQRRARGRRLCTSKAICRLHDVVTARPLTICHHFRHRNHTILQHSLSLRMRMRRIRHIFHFLCGQGHHLSSSGLCAGRPKSPELGPGGREDCVAGGQTTTQRRLRSTARPVDTEKDVGGRLRAAHRRPQAPSSRLDRLPFLIV